MGAAKVAGFVIGGAIALYIFYSIIPGLFDLFGEFGTAQYGETGDQTLYEIGPAGSEALLGATIVVFSALVLYVMYHEFS